MIEKKIDPRAADLEGADPASQRGVPQSSGFGRGGSALEGRKGAKAGAKGPKSSGKGRGLF